jgi:hypothetical protein
MGGVDYTDIKEQHKQFCLRLSNGEWKICDGETFINGFLIVDGTCLALISYEKSSNTWYVDCGEMKMDPAYLKTDMSLEECSTFINTQLNRIEFN